MPSTESIPGVTQSSYHVSNTRRSNFGNNSATVAEYTSSRIFNETNSEVPSAGSPLIEQIYRNNRFPGKELVAAACASGLALGATAAWCVIKATEADTLPKRVMWVGGAAGSVQVAMVGAGLVAKYVAPIVAGPGVVGFAAAALGIAGTYVAKRYYCHENTTSNSVQSPDIEMQPINEPAVDAAPDQPATINIDAPLLSVKANDVYSQ